MNNGKDCTYTVACVPRSGHVVVSGSNEVGKIVRGGSSP